MPVDRLLPAPRRIGSGQAAGVGWAERARAVAPVRPGWCGAVAAVGSGWCRAVAPSRAGRGDLACDRSRCPLGRGGCACPGRGGSCRTSSRLLTGREPGVRSRERRRRSAWAACQTPVTMTLMRAAELLSRRRIFPGSGPVTHSGQFGRGEHLKLPHGTIISPPADNCRLRSRLDHANLSTLQRMFSLPFPHPCLRRGDLRTNQHRTVTDPVEKGRGRPGGGQLFRVPWERAEGLPRLMPPIRCTHHCVMFCSSPPTASAVDRESSAI
jgi:hypothetical protein